MWESICVDTERTGGRDGPRQRRKNSSLLIGKSEEFPVETMSRFVVLGVAVVRLWEVL